MFDPLGLEGHDVSELLDSRNEEQARAVLREQVEFEGAKRTVTQRDRFEPKRNGVMFSKNKKTLDEFKQSKNVEETNQQYHHLAIEDPAKGEAYLTEKVIDEILMIGREGGDLGYAMFNRIVNGEKIKIKFDPSDTAYSESTHVGLNPDYYLWFRGGTPMMPSEAFSYEPAVILGHELGHHLIGLTDPFNVSIVENRLRKSFAENYNRVGFIRRTSYQGYALGLIEPTNSKGKKLHPKYPLNGAMTTPVGIAYVPASRWLEQNRKEQSSYENFMSTWGPKR